jgi:hypothetical protein
MTISTTNKLRIIDESKRKKSLTLKVIRSLVSISGIRIFIGVYRLVALMLMPKMCNSNPAVIRMIGIIRR